MATIPIPDAIGRRTNSRTKINHHRNHLPDEEVCYSLLLVSLMLPIAKPDIWLWPTILTFICL
jgi:hypothetical protein